MVKIFKSFFLWLDSDVKEGIDDVNGEKIDWLRCLPYFITHIACLGVFFVGISTTAVVVCLTAYALRVFALTGFYHRYFSHKAFKTSRFIQFCFAFIGTAAAQRGPLWWAAHHRDHHKYSDQPEDKHSPYQVGFWMSHTGWFLQNKNFKTNTANIKDFLKFPELVFINRFDVIPPLVYGTLLYIFGGWQLLIWGYFISTVMVYHVTFAINSLTHLLGNRTFVTTDMSRNNWWLALLTFGEGWHNNHHYWPSSARQGFKWYQIDISFMILKFMEKLGLVWDLRAPPPEVLNAKPHANANDAIRQGIIAT